MPAANEQVPPFTIREINGLQRQLILRGRALPLRPAKWSSTQRLDVTWVAGSREATSAVFGDSEDPTEFNGVWSDKFIGTEQANVSLAGAKNVGAVPGTSTGRGNAPAVRQGESINSVRDLVRTVKSLQGSGALVEVQWYMERHVGHIKKFERRWLNTNDLEWTLAFEWTGSGDPVPAPPSRAPTTPSQVAEDMDWARTQTKDALSNLPDPLEPSVLDRISDGFALVESTTNSLVDAVSNTTTSAMRPVDAARSCIGTLMGVVGRTRDFATDLTAVPAIYMFHQYGLPVPTSVTGGQRVAAATWQRGTLKKARDMQRAAAIAAANMLREQDSDLLGVYTAKAGDNLRDVSLAYYNSPNQWRTLLVFNALESSVLERGTLVLVPRLSRGDV